MGRKAKNRYRKQDEEKKMEWAKALYPFFQQYGLQGITIDKMAKWIGKSKSTLYEYFETKDEIVGLSILSKLEALQGYKAILNNEQPTYIERYHSLVQFVSNNISDTSNLFLADLKQFYPQAWNLLNDFLEQMLASVQFFYEGGIRAGEFKNIHVAILIHGDRHFIFDLLTNAEFLRQNRITISELAKQYLHLKLNGLAT